MSKLELAKQKYSFYLHWKASGMLDGKFGNIEAMKRMNEIRAILKSENLTMKDLK